MPTATITSAATSRFVNCATSRDNSSSTASSTLVDERKPLHVSIVGGEPLVRYKELNSILPLLSKRGIHTQVVTSAVREIPKEWATIPRLSRGRVDRRAPAGARRAAHARHLRPHPEAHRGAPDRRALHGHAAAGAIDRAISKSSCEFWSAKKETRKIWMSLYTPQIGEVSEERLTPADRAARRRRPARRCACAFRSYDAPMGLIDVYADPPQSPDECVFARTTTAFRPT